MKALISILIGLLVVGCGEKQSTNTNDGNNTPEKPAKKKADKETAEAKAAADWKVIEEVIRGGLLAHYGENPKGELTKSDYEKVTKLSFDRSQLTDVKGLEKLTQLEVLILWRNQLTDVKGLEKLTQLTFLELGQNQLTDVKGLENLTQLKYLALNANKLTSVKGLEKLTKLEKLDLRHNPDLTKSRIAELQKTLPKCKISHDAKK
jgi:hypothetical protein